MIRSEALVVVVEAVHGVAPDIDLTTVDPSADLRSRVDLDSIDFLNIVEMIFERTGVEIPERDYPRLNSLDAFASYVAAAVA